MTGELIMDSDQLQKFKEQLEQMKADVISDVEQTLNDMTSQNGNIPDPNDRATVESDRSFELRLRSRERKLLDKINEAIARIDNGEYGVCDDCGERIRTKRLEARPVAKFCINCKTRQEQKEKAQGN
jgi:DnaK suppressor protein